MFEFLAYVPNYLWNESSIQEIKKIGMFKKVIKKNTSQFIEINFIYTLFYNNSSNKTVGFN